MTRQNAGEATLGSPRGSAGFHSRAPVHRDLQAPTLPAVRERPAGWHFTWLLCIALAGVFVTALIVITGDLATLWPLYIIPVVVAAIIYHTAGATLSIAVVAALIALLTYSPGVESPAATQLFVGVSAFAVSALAIGVQANRHERQRRLLEADALRDAVTGAYTREYVEELLASDVRRAQRYDVRCTFAIVGVVGIREFGRTFGRIKTEQMLGRLADVVRLSVRDTDIVGRWNHDSLGIVLPFTSDAEARLVAERIGSAIDATQFEGDALEPVARCSVAVGHATCPEDEVDSAALIAAVEKRLVEARAAVVCEREARR